MSTNVTFAGVSIKINDDKIDQKSLIEIAKHLGYDEKDLLDLESDDYIDAIYETKKDCWRIYRDVDGQIGLIYLINNDYDEFDLDFTLSLEKLNIHMGMLLEVLPKEYFNMDADNVKIFSHLYYNGSDNPFTF